MQKEADSNVLKFCIAFLVIHAASPRLNSKLKKKQEREKLQLRWKSCPKAKFGGLLCCLFSGSLDIHHTIGVGVS